MTEPKEKERSSMTKTERRLLWFKVVMARNAWGEMWDHTFDDRSNSYVSKLAAEYRKLYNEFLEKSGAKLVDDKTSKFAHGSWTDLRTQDGEEYSWEEPL